MADSGDTRATVAELLLRATEGATPPAEIIAAAQVGALLYLGDRMADLAAVVAARTDWS